MAMESLFVITGVFIGIFGLCCCYACSALYETYLSESADSDQNLLDL